jgi:diaminopimelate decarboxylase
VNKKHLDFAGRDTVELAEKYGTPLMLLNEQGIRDNCQTYKNAVAKYFGGGSVAYANKALSFVGLNKIMQAENMGLDVASPGEIHTADVSGFDMNKVHFHGNIKTDKDIQFALDRKVGFFMVDNFEELQVLNDIAGKESRKQNIFLRLCPGIDVHTLKQIMTGAVDSKFGISIATGQAGQFVKQALESKNIELCGYHCHIGSQVFETEPYKNAVDTFLNFSKLIKTKYGYEAPELILGGGFGVQYTSGQETLDYAEMIKNIAMHTREISANLGLNMPRVGFEPGRSIVAKNGVTLYTICAVKEIPGIKNYVIVDGGMADNPRYALYQAPYTIKHANRVNEESDYTATIAGRTCESGDLIQENVNLPKPVRGDKLAVLDTGAYNYAMASNYNRLARPPIVMIDKDGNDKVAVERESLADLISRDVK